MQKPSCSEHKRPEYSHCFTCNNAELIQAAHQTLNKILLVRNRLNEIQSVTVNKCTTMFKAVVKAHLKIRKGYIKDFVFLDQVHTCKQFIHGEKHHSWGITRAQHCMRFSRSCSSIGKHWPNIIEKLKG